MEKGVWAYPWDLAEEPDAAARYRDMGLTYVSAAARYHAVRELAYLPTGPRVTLHEAGGEFLEAAAAIAERNAKAGLPTDAWIVCFHEDPAPEGQRVVNCFGDEYPWCSCPRNPVARGRILAFIERAASLGVFRTVEVEAFGFYGIEHQSMHDKVTPGPFPVARTVLSVCFCSHCRAAGHELDGFEELAIELFAGDGDTAKMAVLLERQAELRASYVDELLRELKERVAGRARIRMMVSPYPQAYGAGCPVPGPHSTWPDEVTVQVWTNRPEELEVDVREVIRVSPVPVIAGFQTIPPNCPDQAGLRKFLDAAVGTGCAGVCAYHDGMMTPAERKAYGEAIRGL